jgi:hypothetical protein
MASMSRSLSRSARSSIVRTLTLSALLGASALGAACSGSPTGPGALSSERRVGTGGAGGTISPGCLDGSSICEVQVTSAGGTMQGSTEVGTASATNFQFKAQLQPGSGRFSGGGYIDVEVNGTTATIHEISFRRGDARLGDAGVTVPATVRVTEDACRNGGDLIETTIVATLQNFGPTTITERHCYTTLSE